MVGLSEPTDRALLSEPEARLEGALKVTGGARYAADYSVPGMLWLAYARSRLPHARIVRIDTTRAAHAPGVHCVITGEMTQGARLGRCLQDWPVLAVDRVRLVGDRVAAVAAEAKEAAEAAATLVEVDYAELPGVFTPEEALAEGAPILHPNLRAYRYLPDGHPPPTPHPNIHGYAVAQKSETGESIDEVFARAAHVFEHTFTTARQHHGYIEPRACLVWLDDQGRFHVISSNKSPAGLREHLATSLGLEQRQIVIDGTFVGGDFGGKGVSIDEYTGYFLARLTGRPIKAVMSYYDAVTT